MATENIYSIKISGINYECPNYHLWRNGQYIEPEDLTIEELKLFQKKLLDFSEMFKDRIKYIKEL